MSFFRSNIAILSSIILILSIGATSTAYADNVLEVKIPASILTNKIKSSFKGTKVHLNNYGKRNGNSWYKGSSSYIKFPSSLGGSKHSFSLSPENRFPFRYYVNDINLKSHDVRVSNGRFLLKFNFEDHGTEVKGRCAGGGAKKVICVAKGSDRTAPDIHMKNMIASVYLTPAVRNGSISFSKVSTSFTANIRIGKTCNILKKLKLGGLCKKVESTIKNGVKSALKKSLDNNRIRDSIAKTLRSELSKRGIKKIVSAKIKGNFIVVGFRI